MRCMVCEQPLEKAFFGKIGGMAVSLCEKHFKECGSCENKKRCSVHNRICTHD